MRVASSVLVVGLSACNAVLGIGEIRVSGGDDGGEPDAPSKDVHGTALDTWHVSPTQTMPFPEDLSRYTLQAFVPDDSPSGFHIIDGTGAKDGTFTIPDVPAGAYYLFTRVPDDAVAHFYRTASRTPALGVTRLGRPGAPAAHATPVSFHASSSSVFVNGDFLFVESYATGGETILTAAQDNTVTDEVIDWSAIPSPLPEAAKGDDVFVLLQRRELTPPAGEDRTSIVGAYATTALTLVDGQPATLNAALQAPTVRTNVQWTFAPFSYTQDLDYTSHLAASMAARARATFFGGAGQGPPLFRTSRAADIDPVPTISSFLDPFPADWTRSVLVSAGVQWRYATRMTRTPDLVSGQAIERKPFETTMRFTAPFAAPHAITVAGVESGRSAAVPFDGTHPVTVAWAPTLGAHHYSVRVIALPETGPADVATFDTDTEAIAMPAALFTVGESYILTVTAIVDPNTDYPGGVLRLVGYPNSEREAATARLLFAASCGNGAVDAAYEQCDSSGVATADCNPDCTRPACGDGYVNTAAGEACDDAGDSLICKADCTRK